MATERGMQIKGDLNLSRAVDNGEFPILCEGCLGDNPYIRMQVDPHGGTCRMCMRPYTVYKWRPGRGESYRKTEVCQVCSKTKNLCQTCILDLQFGLPTQLRDAVLSTMDGAISLPESDVNKEYLAQQKMAVIAAGNDPWKGTGMDNPNEQLLKMARNADMNRAQPRVKLPENFPAVENKKRKMDQNSLYVNNLNSLHPEVDPNNATYALPPGISSASQLAATMDKNRMPAGFLSLFEEKESTDKIAKNSNNGDGSTEKIEHSEDKKHGKKKFTPKPPSGPPPESAFVK